MDNTAIARIASHDLTDDALALLEKHGGSDSVIFFLGRLAWQGEMKALVPPLAIIAGDPGRDVYARIAAARAVMTLGTAQQKDDLWAAVTAQSEPLERNLLVELLEWTAPNSASVDQLIPTLENLAPSQRYDVTGLADALHHFIDQLPIMVDDVADQPLSKMVTGLQGLLSREPFIERGECNISKEFAWLLSPALHAVERLVAARSASALAPASIEVMRHIWALRAWGADELTEYKTQLGVTVPKWPELNDRLYWTSVADTRAKLAEKSEALQDDWAISWVGHFWSFGAGDFERCLSWVQVKDGDDRLVALSRSVRIYVENDRPEGWLAALHTATQGDAQLEAFLAAWLDPKPSPTMERMEAQHRQRERRYEKRKRKEEENRADWVRHLKENPDRVQHPLDVEPGTFTPDQYWLLSSALGDGHLERAGGANWRSLIPEFGETVAMAYRDAAVAYWRNYKPELGSEGTDIRSTPLALIFAMAGLAIEYNEDSMLAQHLTTAEAEHAFRYVVWELNGLPAWFEPLYLAHRDAGRAFIAKELTWELERSATGESMHYILHDILYHSPWLHADATSIILPWLLRHDMTMGDPLRHALNILSGAKVSADELRALAVAKLENASDEEKPIWYALWADTDPDAATLALDEKLASMPLEDAGVFAQQFVVNLVGDRRGGTRIGAYRNAKNLKDLYVLMHRYIRAEDDIERAGTGVYSPTLRDDARRARESLFSLLAAAPGPEAYAAMKALENEHPDPSFGRWMGLRARERAVTDADEPLWSVEQVRQFEQDIVNEVRPLNP